MDWSSQHERAASSLSPLLGPDGRPLANDEKPYDAFALPHVLTYGSLFNAAQRTYWHDRFDEAMRFSREAALAMRRDPYLLGLVQERKLAISSLNWHLEVPDDKHPKQVEVREHLTKALKGIPFLHRLVYALLDAIWYGRYGVQVRYGWEIVNGRRSLTLADWLPVNGDKIEYHFDGTPYVLVHASSATDLPGVETTLTTRGKAITLSGTWRQRFFIHKHEVDDADYFDAEAAGGVHGVGIRSRLFWIDWMEKEYLEWITTYMERVGLGLTIWYYEAGNASSKEEAEAAARKQSNRTNIVWPRPADGKGGAGVERIETPATGSELLLKLRETIRDDKRRYVIGQTLSSDSEGGGLGGNGVADLHAQTKNKIIAHDSRSLAETMTGGSHAPGLVWMMQRWTFPATMPGPQNTEGFQVRMVYDVDQPEPEKTLQAVRTAWDMGAHFKEEEVVALTGLSIPEQDDRILENPMIGQQKAQAAAAQQAQMGGGGQPPGPGDPPPGGGGGPQPGGPQQPGGEGEAGDGGPWEPKVLSRGPRKGKVVGYNPRTGHYKDDTEDFLAGVHALSREEQAALYRRLRDACEPEATADLEIPDRDDFLGGLRGVLFGDALELYAAKDPTQWVPHILLSGPNKGQSAWKHVVTGEITHDDPSQGAPPANPTGPTQATEGGGVPAPGDVGGTGSKPGAADMVKVKAAHKKAVEAAASGDPSQVSEMMSDLANMSIQDLFPLKKMLGVTEPWKNKENLVKMLADKLFAVPDTTLTGADGGAGPAKPNKAAAAAKAGGVPLEKELDGYLAEGIAAGDLASLKETLSGFSIFQLFPIQKKLGIKGWAAGAGNSKEYLVGKILDALPLKPPDAAAGTGAGPPPDTATLGQIEHLTAEYPGHFAEVLDGDSWATLGVEVTPGDNAALAESLQGAGYKEKDGKYFVPHADAGMLEEIASASGVFPKSEKDEINALDTAKKSAARAAFVKAGGTAGALPDVTKLAGLTPAAMENLQQLQAGHMDVDSLAGSFSLGTLHDVAEQLGVEQVNETGYGSYSGAKVKQAQVLLDHLQGKGKAGGLPAGGGDAGGAASPAPAPAPVDLSKLTGIYGAGLDVLKKVQAGTAGAKDIKDSFTLFGMNTVAKKLGAKQFKMDDAIAAAGVLDEGSYQGLLAKQAQAIADHLQGKGKAAGGVTPPPAPVDVSKLNVSDAAKHFLGLAQQGQMDAKGLAGNLTSHSTQMIGEQLGLDLHKLEGGDPYDPTTKVKQSQAIIDHLQGKPAGGSAASPAPAPKAAPDFTKVTDPDLSHQLANIAAGHWNTFDDDEKAQFIAQLDAKHLVQATAALGLPHVAKTKDMDDYKKQAAAALVAHAQGKPHPGAAAPAGKPDLSALEKANPNLAAELGKLGAGGPWHDFTDEDKAKHLTGKFLGTHLAKGVTALGLDAQAITAGSKNHDEYNQKLAAALVGHVSKGGAGPSSTEDKIKGLPPEYKNAVAQAAGKSLDAAGSDHLVATLSLDGLKGVATHFKLPPPALGDHPNDLSNTKHAYAQSIMAHLKGGTTTGASTPSVADAIKGLKLTSELQKVLTKAADDPTGGVAHLVGTLHLPTMAHIATGLGLKPLAEGYQPGWTNKDLTDAKHAQAKAILDHLKGGKAAPSPPPPGGKPHVDSLAIPGHVKELLNLAQEGIIQADSLVAMANQPDLEEALSVLGYPDLKPPPGATPVEFEEFHAQALIDVLQGKKPGAVADKPKLNLGPVQKINAHLADELLSIATGKAGPAEHQSAADLLTASYQAADLKKAVDALGMHGLTVGKGANTLDEFKQKMAAALVGHVAGKLPPPAAPAPSGGKPDISVALAGLKTMGLAGLPMALEFVAEGKQGVHDLKLFPINGLKQAAKELGLPIPAHMANAKHTDPNYHDLKTELATLIADHVTGKGTPPAAAKPAAKPKFAVDVGALGLGGDMATTLKNVQDSGYTTPLHSWGMANLKAMAQALHAEPDPGQMAALGHGKALMEAILAAVTKEAPVASAKPAAAPGEAWSKLRAANLGEIVQGTLTDVSKGKLAPGEALEDLKLTDLQAAAKALGLDLAGLSSTDYYDSKMSLLKAITAKLKEASRPVAGAVNVYALPLHPSDQALLKGVQDGKKTAADLAENHYAGELKKMAEAVGAAVPDTAGMGTVQAEEALAEAIVAHLTGKGGTTGASAATGKMIGADIAKAFDGWANEMHKSAVLTDLTTALDKTTPEEGAQFLIGEGYGLPTLKGMAESLGLPLVNDKQGMAKAISEKLHGVTPGAAPKAGVPTLPLASKNIAKVQAGLDAALDGTGFTASEALTVKSAVVAALQGHTSPAAAAEYLEDHLGGDDLMALAHHLGVTGKSGPALTEALVDKLQAMAGDLEIPNASPPKAIDIDKLGFGGHLASPYSLGILKAVQDGTAGVSKLVGSFNISALKVIAEKIGQPLPDLAGMSTNEQYHTAAQAIVDHLQWTAPGAAPAGGKMTKEQLDAVSAESGYGTWATQYLTQARGMTPHEATLHLQASFPPQGIELIAKTLGLDPEGKTNQEIAQAVVQKIQGTGGAGASAFTPATPLRVPIDINSLPDLGTLSDAQIKNLKSIQAGQIDAAGVATLYEYPSVLEYMLQVVGGDMPDSSGLNAPEYTKALAEALVSHLKGTAPGAAPVGASTPKKWDAAALNDVVDKSALDPLVKNSMKSSLASYLSHDVAWGAKHLAEGFTQTEVWTLAKALGMDPALMPNVYTDKNAFAEMVVQHLKTGSAPGGAPAGASANPFAWSASKGHPPLDLAKQLAAKYPDTVEALNGGAGVSHQFAVKTDGNPGLQNAVKALGGNVMLNGLAYVPAQHLEQLAAALEQHAGGTPAPTGDDDAAKDALLATAKSVDGLKANHLTFLQDALANSAEPDFLAQITPWEKLVEIGQALGLDTSEVEQTAGELDSPDWLSNLHAAKGPLAEAIYDKLADLSEKDADSVFPATAGTPVDLDFVDLGFHDVWLPMLKALQDGSASADSVVQSNAVDVHDLMNMLEKTGGTAPSGLAGLTPADKKKALVAALEHHLKGTTPAGAGVGTIDIDKVVAADPSLVHANKIAGFLKDVQAGKYTAQDIGLYVGWEPKLVEPSLKALGIPLPDSTGLGSSQYTEVLGQALINHLKGTGPAPAAPSLPDLSGLALPPLHIQSLIAAQNGTIAAEDLAAKYYPGELAAMLSAMGAAVPPNAGTPDEKAEILADAIVAHLAGKSAAAPTPAPTAAPLHDPTVLNSGLQTGMKKLLAKELVQISHKLGYGKPVGKTKAAKAAWIAHKIGQAYKGDPAATAAAVNSMIGAAFPAHHAKLKQAFNALLKTPGAATPKPAPAPAPKPKPKPKAATAPKGPPVLSPVQQMLQQPPGSHAPGELAKALKGEDVHALEPTWALQPGKKAAYGAVVIGPDGKVLLRQPTGNYDGYAWTFAKGGADAGEHPVDVALRELLEETGHSGDVVGLVPGNFAGGTSQNFYFLVHSTGVDPSKMDKETSGVKWVSPEEAAKHIGQTTNATGKARDLAVLKAALAHYGKLKDPLGALAEDFPGLAEVHKSSASNADQVAVKVPQNDPAAAHLQALGGQWSNSKGYWKVPTDKTAQIGAALEAGGHESAKAFPKPHELDQLEFVSNLKGSTGAKKMAFGGNHYAYKEGNTAGHVVSEHAADNAYQVLGIPVPKGKLYDKSGSKHGHAKLAQWIEGVDLEDYLSSATPAQKQAVIAQLREHFVADALFANYDVIGMHQDNIKVDKDGTAWRIDNGGSFNYRAQGKKKDADQWSDSVVEIDSMRNKSINPSAAAVFAGITDAEIAEQVGAILKKKDALLAACPAAVKARMEKRLDWLAKHYPPPLADLMYKGGKLYSVMKAQPLAGTPPDKSKVYTVPPADAGHIAFKNYADGEQRVGFTSSNAPPSFKAHALAAQKRTPKAALAAAKKFTGNSFHALVEAMQECPETLDCLSPEHKKWADGIDEAIAAQGVLDTPLNVWRQFSVGNADEFYEFMAACQGLGQEIQLPGPKSTSTKTGTWHGNICLEIKARTGVYAQPVSNYASEQEWLMSHHAKFRVTGIKEVNLKGVGTQKVVQLEEVVD
jgi:8-oxo-dGTP pyrophosphatase MutT (NUDIX family)